MATIEDDVAASLASISPGEEAASSDSAIALTPEEIAEALALLEGDLDTSEQGRLRIEHREPVKNYGPDTLEDLPYSYFSVLTQMRRIYDRQAEDELTRAIDQYGLMHPYMVNRLTFEEAEQYIAGVNRTYRARHTVDDLTLAADGFYYPVLAGHRRHRAIGRLIQLDQLSPDEVTVKVNVQTGLVSFEGLKRQMVENVMSVPRPWEFAYAVRDLYEIGLVERSFNSVAGFARQMPFGEDKIRSAIKFSLLPDKVRGLVEAGKLQYVVALELVPLLQAYMEREEDPQVIEDNLLVLALRAMDKDPKERWGQQRMHRHVLGRVDAIRMEQMSMDQVFAEGSERSERIARRMIENERRRIVREKLVRSVGNMNDLIWLQTRGFLGEGMKAIRDREVVDRLRTMTDLFKRLFSAAGIEIPPDLPADIEKLRQAIDLLPEQEALL